MSEAQNLATNAQMESLLAELQGEAGLYRTTTGLLAIRHPAALSVQARTLALEAVTSANKAVESGEYRLDAQLYLVPTALTPQASVSYGWSWAGLIVYITLNSQEASNASGYLSGILSVGGGALYRIPYATAALGVISGLVTIVGTYCNRNGRGALSWWCSLHCAPATVTRVNPAAAVPPILGQGGFLVILPG